MGAKTAGYGVLQRGRRGQGIIKAHRLSWQIHHGDIPENLYVCHRCDTPACVRPDHLFVGDQATNMNDCKEKGRARAPFGVDHPRAKLTESDVLAVRASTEGPRSLGRRLGISHCQIVAIRQRRSWKHI